MREFATKKIRSWADFTSHLSSQDEGWVYRGQRSDWPLASSLERSLLQWGLGLESADKIERQLIRDFRRRYRAQDRSDVVHDTAYCMSLMQHHGAPTRCLDFTYSPYVSAKFAVEGGSRNGVIWCLNNIWCHKAAARIVGTDILDRRGADSSRDDASFKPLYLTHEPRTFAWFDNPHFLNERLIVQRGVFLIAGDIRKTLVDNITNMRGHDRRDAIIKLQLDLRESDLKRFALELHKMNMTSSALFPGIDGFARSLHESLYLYELEGRLDTGGPNSGIPARSSRGGE